MTKTKVIAVANQKGGVGKSTSVYCIGAGLAMNGKKVLMLDVDPQGDLTKMLGQRKPHEMPLTLANVMNDIVAGIDADGHPEILHHVEGFDYVPANRALSAVEVGLVNAMSRETVLRQYLDGVKKDYDYVLLDCRPSLGMLVINEKFTVGYTTGTNGESIMTIAMTAAGLNEINTNSAVYTGASAVNSGYSDCTLRIFYAATLDTDSSLILGDTGNPNEVTLTWKRSNTSFYDTLSDDAAVYSFGLDVTKNFSDGRGDATKVEFLIQNSTDNYYLTGSLNTTENVWYVTGKTADANSATHFIPTTAGKLTVKGLEDDAYTLTEVKTDSAYTLLKAPVQVVISKNGSAVSATVDGKAVNMSAVGASGHALVPFTIINTRGFDLPQTGGTGNWLFPVIGMVMLAACITGIVILMKKKPAQE